MIVRNQDLPEEKLAFQKRARSRVVAILRFLWLFMILAVLLYGPTDLYRGVCRSSPLLFLTSLFSYSETVRTLSSIGLGLLSSTIVIFCMIRRRFFCKYLCPLGLALDAGCSLRRRLFKKHLLKNGLRIKTKAFFAFFATLWTLSWGSTFLLSQNFCTTIEGFTLLAFDPLAIVSGAVVYFPKITIVLVVFILCFIISPYFWRYSFCPCGALQELLYLPHRAVRKLLKRSVQSSVSQNKTRSRRKFFEIVGASAVGGAAFAALNKLGTALKPVFFRPPGARTERDFLARCAHCGRCVAACPNKIIKPLELTQAKEARIPTLQANLIAETPIIEYNESFCEKECVACSEACPTGAIRPISILDKPKYPIALAQFELEKCLLYYNRECSICRRECSYEAISFLWSDDAYANIPTIDEDLCVGCGQCVVFCPGEPILDALGELVDEETQEENLTKREKALKLVLRNH